MSTKVDRIYECLTPAERISMIEDLALKATINNQESPSIMLELNKIRDSTPRSQVNEYNVKYHEMMTRIIERSRVSHNLMYAYMSQLLAEAQKRILFDDMKMFVCCESLRISEQQAVDFRKVATDAIMTPEAYREYFKNHGALHDDQELFEEYPDRYAEFVFFSVMIGECERIEAELLSDEEKRELEEIESQIKAIEDYDDEDSTNKWAELDDKKEKLLALTKAFDMRNEEIRESEWKNKEEVDKLLEYDKELLEKFRIERSRTANEIFEIIEEFYKKHEPELYEHCFGFLKKNNSIKE